MVDKRMADEEWKDLMQIVSFSRDAQVKFGNDHMTVVKAVAECDPITEEFDDHGGYSQSCFFCGKTHRDDCIHILAKKIMEDEKG